MAGYAPLEFLNRSQEQYIAAEIPNAEEINNGQSYKYHVSKLLTQVLGVPENYLPSEEWFIKYILSNEFLTRASDHKEKCFNTKKYPEIIQTHSLAAYLDIEFFKLAPNMLQALGYKASDIQNALKSDSRIKDVKSEIKDSIVETLILDRWIRNKQVYKPDKTFAKYLLNTSELKIAKDFFEHLPYNTFYVDLEDANNENTFGNIHGVFVDITILSSNQVALTMYMLSQNLLSYSDYMIFNLDLAETINTTDFDENVEFDKIPLLESQVTGNETINIRAVTTLILQLLCYMKVREPDICAAPEMAHTYKPNKHGGKIVNKYNEVMKHEVGIKIGKTITNNIKAMKKAEKEQRENFEKDTSNKDRKPPVPHFRSAHWHRFWCGSEKQNNKRLELRWIEPTFVCSTYSSKSQTDVIIHNVNNN